MGGRCKCIFRNLQKTINGWMKWLGIKFGNTAIYLDGRSLRFGFSCLTPRQGYQRLSHLKQNMCSTKLFQASLLEQHHHSIRIQQMSCELSLHKITTLFLLPFRHSLQNIHDGSRACSQRCHSLAILFF
jgi:hypothetical protein